jgi:hypothetical protein
MVDSVFGLARFSAVCPLGGHMHANGLPLLVREAAHHGRGIFAVDEEACSDGLVVYPVAEAVVPPRGPCFSGGAGGAEVCGRAANRAAGLGVPGARAVGFLDGGADMFVRMEEQESPRKGLFWLLCPTCTYDYSQHSLHLHLRVLPAPAPLSPGIPPSTRPTAPKTLVE